MKGAIYSRVSTDIQDFTKQTNELKDFAKYNNIDIVYIFEEKESGFNNDRPEFERLKRLTKADIDIVLIWELSRLSRRSIYLQQQVEEFTNKGINIYSKKEGLYTLDQNGKENPQVKFTIAILAAVAEQEVSTLKERTISSKRNKIFNLGNSYTSKPPYGYEYNKETKKLTINEDEANLMKRIFDLSINGYSLKRIALLLNSEGKRTKSNNLWTYTTVFNMFHNTVYYGKAQYRTKSEQSKEGKKYRKKLEFRYVSVPAIITEDVYNRTREKLKSRNSRSNSVNQENDPLLRGLIICPICGYRYTCEKNSGLYTCINVGVKHCKGRTIKISNLDRIVWEITLDICNSDINKETGKNIISEIKSQMENLKREIFNIDKSIDDLKIKADNIFNAAIEVKRNFPNLADLYKDKMNELKPINKDISIYENEKSIKQREITRLEIKEKDIIESRDIVITDKSEKSIILHKVVDNIKIYGYQRGKCCITVEFKNGCICYIYYISKYKFGVDYTWDIKEICDYSIEDKTFTFNEEMNEDLFNKKVAKYIKEKKFIRIK